MVRGVTLRNRVQQPQRDMTDGRGANLHDPFGVGAERSVALGVSLGQPTARHKLVAGSSGGLPGDARQALTETLREAKLSGVRWVKVSGRVLINAAECPLLWRTGHAGIAGMTQPDSAAWCCKSATTELPNYWSLQSYWTNPAAMVDMRCHFRVSLIPILLCHNRPTLRGVA